MALLWHCPDSVLDPDNIALGQVSKLFQLSRPSLRICGPLVLQCRSPDPILKHGTRLDLLRRIKKGSISCRVSTRARSLLSLTSRLMYMFQYMLKFTDLSLLFSCVACLLLCVVHSSVYSHALIRLACPALLRCQWLVSSCERQNVSDSDSSFSDS